MFSWFQLMYINTAIFGGKFKHLKIRVLCSTMMESTGIKKFPS